MRSRLLLLPLFFLTMGQGQVEKESEGSLAYYLLRYGYIHDSGNDNTAALLSSDGLRDAVKEFQAFAGLDATGELTSETLELMNTPRCGVPDMVGQGSVVAKRRRRRKRYALQGSRWRTQRLTYRITRYPSTTRFSRERVDSDIAKAFELWARETRSLSFERKESGSVHIEIRFERREHGDGDPFDGLGGTLAHAFFPQFGGDAHFDDQEFWTVDEFRGTNLLQVAAHEFGHSLGLSHSDVRSALMAPFYKGWQPDLRLDRDDVDGIQRLYGRPEDNVIDNDEDGDDEEDEADLPSEEDEEDDEDEGSNADLCSDSRVDAIFGTGDSRYYVFKGSLYWRLTDESVAPGFPRRISDDWEGLPDNIDAAVTWTNNSKTYFFKNDQYWRFDNQRADPGYPKRIGQGFRGAPSNIDAAFVWGGNGKIYFFKNDQYWKFDPSRKPPIRNVYPRPISNWGLPNDIDGALRWSNRFTYFFHRDNYYRFNDARFAVDTANPAFPRPTGRWWFGCDNENINNGVNNDNNVVDFDVAGLAKEEGAVSLFDLEGDETLDASPGDEK